MLIGNRSKITDLTFLFLQ
ncbi:hypothetical protein F383_39057 [Gossypium arboreum]|uniref:Uncharacterized protein n=1 Tax=Gossypium arboreum TaxID=29729 RepID=A0A0B0MIM6_GOSAR|nr:hypothetical protein F383_39057 [Gossypium arboreum]